MKKEKLPGRPRIEDEPQLRCDISLCNRLQDKARRIGKGNKSKGIRVALESYREEE